MLWPAPPVDGVDRSVERVDGVVAGVAHERVVAGSADDGVIAIGAGDGVVAVVAAEQVVLVVADDRARCRRRRIPCRCSIPPER